MQKKLNDENKNVDRAKLESAQPMWKIVLSQFAEHRLAVVGAIVVSLFICIALSAPLISAITGLSPEDQNVYNRYKPVMTKLSVPADQREATAERYIEVYPEQAQTLSEKLLSLEPFQNVSSEDVLFDLVLLEPQESLHLLSQVKEAPTNFVGMVKGFEKTHWLGTDELGRDVLMRLIYGTRVSIGVGMLVALASALVGLIIGSLAGYYGGWLETLLMRVTDSLLSLPLLPVLIVVAAIDFSKVPVLKVIVTPENQAIMKLVVILCLFSWMVVARLVRGSILSLKEREFILAAKTLGATDSTIILRHIIPNVIAPLLVAVTLGVGESILFEAALSYLGMGIQPPTPSWGNMLFNAQELIYERPLLAILPGLLILATVISFNYIGDGLQDAIDPKSIKR